MEQLQTENSAAGGLSDLTDVLDVAAKNAHIMRVMGSSEDMTWATPKEWFEYLNLEFGFTLDPCCCYDLHSLRELESETEKQNRLLREENAALRRVLMGAAH